MIVQLPGRCWVIDLDAWGAYHFATRDEGEQQAARWAVEDDNPPDWPVKADTPCWTAMCACGAGLLTAWEAGQYDDPPTEPLHRPEPEAIAVDRELGGQCVTCWTAAEVAR